MENGLRAKLGEYAALGRNGPKSFDCLTFQLNMAIVLPALIATAIKAATALIGFKLAIIPILITSLAFFRYDKFDPEVHPQSVERILPEYDFIVIGAGSAGSVLGNRLTEVPDWKVLVVEAGGPETEITDVPMLSLFLHKSKLDWQYRYDYESFDTMCKRLMNADKWPAGGPRRCRAEKEIVFVVIPQVTRTFAFTNGSDVNHVWKLEWFRAGRWLISFRFEHVAIFNGENERLVRRPGLFYGNRTCNLVGADHFYSIFGRRQKSQRLNCQ